MTYAFLIELRLYFRNRMALVYGYLFPLIFLAAFLVLYRHEAVPLVGHMGELLTVTALGGACFGLPTSMVGERERGVWRRYRATPVSTLHLVLTTVAARYLVLLTAAVLQIAVAWAIGAPLPEHMVGLWIAFTFVSFAFLGLGLVIAMLADTVPAVQALGQSVFLPMLIIGGVAVRIESLPVWAQHLSAFFPGRYAVEAIQATVNGGGLGVAGFSMLALLLIGASGCLASARMFRWDTRERGGAAHGKAWAAAALAGWLLAGVLAETTDHALPRGRLPAGAAASLTEALHATGADDRSDREGMQDMQYMEGMAAAETQHPGDAYGTAADSMATPGSKADSANAAPGPSDAPGAPAAVAAVATPPEETAPAASGEQAEPPLPTWPIIDYPDSWEEVTLEDIDRDIRFDALPYDQGLEAPVAALDEPVYPDIEATIQCILEDLEVWPPAWTADPVQRARNVLFVAAVPDMYQMSGIERWAPHAVFEHLANAYPEDELIQVLYWIAFNPYEGDVFAAERLGETCLRLAGPDDTKTLQQRTGWYAAKLLGRITGHIAVR